MPAAHPLDPIAPFADAFATLLTRDGAAARARIEEICQGVTEERDSILTGLEKCREALRPSSAIPPPRAISPK